MKKKKFTMSSTEVPVTDTEIVPVTDTEINTETKEKKSETDMEIITEAKGKKSEKKKYETPTEDIIVLREKYQALVDAVPAMIPYDENDKDLFAFCKSRNALRIEKNPKVAAAYYKRSVEDKVDLKDVEEKMAVYEHWYSYDCDHDMNPGCVYDIKLKEFLDYENHKETLLKYINELELSATLIGFNKFSFIKEDTHFYDFDKVAPAGIYGRTRDFYKGYSQLLDTEFILRMDREWSRVNRSESSVKLRVFRESYRHGESQQVTVTGAIEIKFPEMPVLDLDTIRIRQRRYMIFWFVRRNGHLYRIAVRTKKFPKPTASTSPDEVANKTLNEANIETEDPNISVAEALRDIAEIRLDLTESMSIGRDIFYNAIPDAVEPDLLDAPPVPKNILNYIKTIGYERFLKVSIFGDDEKKKKRNNDDGTKKKRKSDEDAGGDDDVVGSDNKMMKC